MPSIASMPSWIHDGLVALFHENPSLVTDLLARRGWVVTEPLEAVPSDLTDTKPAELRADAVFVTVGSPRLAIIVEVQRSIDADKPFIWPAYVAGTRLRHRCTVMLLVIALDAAVARWCAAPIEIMPGQCLSPLVIGPELIPPIVDIEVATAQPELACLSALAHRSPATVRAAASALWPRPDECGALCLDILHAAFAAQPELLEEVMRTRTYEYQSEFARKYFNQGQQRGLEQGREEGLEQGLEKGLEQGLARGRQVLVHALLQLLAVRGIPTTQAHKQRIMDAELAQLEAWIPRAGVATTLKDVFGD